MKQSRLSEKRYCYRERSQRHHQICRPILRRNLGSYATRIQEIIKRDPRMNCVIYLRGSTKEQVEKGENAEGFPIPAQREACIKYIQEKGWNLFVVLSWNRFTLSSL